MKSFEAWLKTNNTNLAPNDSLFKSKEGIEKDYALINEREDSAKSHTLFLMIEGYRDCSIILIDRLLSDNDLTWIKIDTFIFPIVYNFRQYLELVMKDIVRNQSMYYKKTASDEIGFQSIHQTRSFKYVI